MLFYLMVIFLSRVLNVVIIMSVMITIVISYNYTLLNRLAATVLHPD